MRAEVNAMVMVRGTMHAYKERQTKKSKRHNRERDMRAKVNAMVMVRDKMHA